MANEAGVTPLARLGQWTRVGKLLLRELRRFSMADVPRITVEELKRRMDAGEDFTVIDVRNPNAWAETDTVIPEAIRVPLDKLEDSLPRIPKSRPVVAYCT
jgi:Rhodanese-like domain